VWVRFCRARRTFIEGIGLGTISDTPKAAAQRFHVTENTIRTPLKSVLAKTDAPAGRSGRAG
jgi:hypothetical protein